MNQQKQLDEQKTAGASYILTFYNEIQALKHWCAVYSNTMANLEHKYNKNINEASLEEEEKLNYNNIMEQVKYHVRITYMSFMAINSALQQRDIKVKKHYDTFKMRHVPESDTLERYTAALNEFLLKDIVQNLLQTSQQLVEQIFSENDSRNTAK